MLALDRFVVVAVHDQYPKRGDVLQDFFSIQGVLQEVFKAQAALMRTLRFTLLAACRLGAVALTTQITRIRIVELSAAQAVALGGSLRRQTQKFESLLVQD